MFLGKWLALAFVLESLMIAYLPGSLIIRTVGGEGWVGRHRHAGRHPGLSQRLRGPAAGLRADRAGHGAGLASFLVAAGISSIPAAMAVFAVARRPVFFAYVGFAVLGSLTAGLAYGLLA